MPIARSSEPLVSVLLAVRDGERFLERAVRSMLRQSSGDLELVVVDDASTDRTAELLAAVDDPRLRVFRNDEQRGLAASLDLGLEHVRGRYVARLDADDVALPGRLEAQVARLRSDPRLGIVGSSVLELDDADRVGRLHVMPAGQAAIRWAALFSSPFFHPTVVVDRDVLDRHGLRYEPDFAESEDYELWTRVLSVTDGDNLPEPLVLYRVHAGQASQRRRPLQRELQLRVALREIGRMAPDLTQDQAELAWEIGVGESVDPERLDDAAAAYAELLHAFERAHGTGVREKAGRALARAALRASGSTSARVLAQALRLDPALPAHAVLARTRRVRAGRGARRPAEAWLGELDGAPIRVAAIFPEPTPYRAPLLDRISALDEIDLTVLYAAPTVAKRTWRVEPRHEARYLRGLRVPGAERILHHDYPVTPGIARELERVRPQVVVASGWSTFAAQGAIAWCRLRKVPYVLVVESHDEAPRRGWRKRVKRAVVPPIVRNAAGTLVTGTLARSSMLARGAAPERVRVFANTIDVEGFGERADRLAARRPELRADLGAVNDDVVVLSVSRLVPEKAHDVLLRAAEAASDRRLLVVLAGDGPERERLEELAHQLGVRAVFPGDVVWERIAELYVAADVFALLSKREPWAVVVNEAAACGLPLVLSDQVGAAHDLLRDGENGVLVGAGDTAAAAEALRRLAADPDERRRMAARSREIARDWGYGPSISGFLAAVRDAVSDGRPG